jgi:hypothetical protein
MVRDGEAGAAKTDKIDAGKLAILQEAPRLASWRERAGEAEGVFVALWEAGAIAERDASPARWPPRSVRCGASRATAPSPPPAAARTSFAMSRLLSGCFIPPGVDTHKGRSWWGVRRCVTRHLLPWRWGRNRAATPCARAQLQHPRRAGPPSRRPIRPKRAAVSRLFAQNVGARLRVIVDTIKMAQDLLRQNLPPKPNPMGKPFR